MKHILFTLLLSSSFFTSAQNTAGWFIDGHAGTRMGGKISQYSTLSLGFHADGGIGYMINPVFGIKFDAGFDTYQATHNTSGKIDRSYGIRLTTHGIVSVSELFKFGIDNFGLNFHAGYGFTAQLNPSVRESDVNAGVVWNDPAIKGSDDHMNIVFGLNPQYHFSQRFSMSLDFSTLLHPMQDHYVDLAFDRSITDKMGLIYNVGIGFQYRIPSTSSRFN